MRTDSPRSGTIDPSFPPIRIPNPVAGERDYSADFLLSVGDDGSFVVGCQSDSFGQRPCLARVGRDGQLDTTFGIDGYAFIDIAGFPEQPPYLAEIHPVSDDLGEGYLARLAVPSERERRTIEFPGLARFTLDGQKVTHFGDDGAAVYLLDPEPSALPSQLRHAFRSRHTNARRKRFWFGSTGDLHVLDDGKLLMLASVHDIQEGTHRAYVLRLTSSGEFDTTFNHRGFMEPKRDTWFAPYRLLPSREHFIISGAFPGTGFIARYDAQGNIDPSFGYDGYFAEFGAYGFSFWHRLLPSGDDIVCVGRRGGRNFLEGRGVVPVCKIDHQGRRVNSFNLGQTVLLEPSNPNDAVLAAFDAMLDSEGRTVIGGREMAAIENYGFLIGSLARLTRDGQRDTSFGSGGMWQSKDIVSIDSVIADRTVGYVVSAMEDLGPLFLLRFIVEEEAARNDCTS